MSPSSPYSMTQKTRICRKCEEKKPLSAYHNDPKGKDQKAAQCAVCKNSARKKTHTIVSKVPLKLKVVRDKLLPSHAPEAISRPSRVSIEAVHDLNSDIQATVRVLNRIMEKHQHHFSISMDKKKFIGVQVHGNPDIHWRGPEIENVLTEVC